jgi:hypothetical protein
VQGTGGSRASRQSENSSGAEAERLQNGMFRDSILHGHHGGRGHEGQDESDAGVGQPVREGDELGEIRQSIALKHAFGPRRGSDRSGLELGIDRRSKSIGVRRLAEPNFKLGDGADRILAASALQEIKVRVDEAVFGGQD